MKQMPMYIDPGAIRQIINVNMNKTLKSPGIKGHNAGIMRDPTEKTVTIFESPAMSPKSRKKQVNQSF